MKLPNLKFKDYLVSEYRYTIDFYTKHSDNLKPEDYFKVGPFMDLSFGFVKDMQYALLYNPYFDWQDFLNVTSEITGLTLLELAETPIFDMIKFRKYCEEESTKIHEMEEGHLGHDQTPEEVEADLSVFSKYGPFIQLDKLAEGNILKIQQVRKEKYSLCFTKLKLDADRYNYDKRLREIQTRKMKNK